MCLTYMKKLCTVPGNTEVQLNLCKVSWIQMRGMTWDQNDALFLLCNDPHSKQQQPSWQPTLDSEIHVESEQTFACF